MNETFIVVELQTYNDGNVGCLTTSFQDRNQAESAWHGVMAAAAVSTVPVHAALLVDSLGTVLLSAHYEH